MLQYINVFFGCVVFFLVFGFFFFCFFVALTHYSALQLAH